jgi:hypothetical protein
MNAVNIDLATPVWQLTAGQFLDLLKQGLPAEVIKAAEAPQIDTTKGKFLYGYAGLSKYLRKSYTTIWRLIKSGQLDEALIRVGSHVLFNADKIPQKLETR